MGGSHRTAIAAVTGLAVAALTAAPAAAHSIDISVLSSRADQVSGGDALVRVDAPRGLLDKLAVLRNGDDVTDAFRRDGRCAGRARRRAARRRQHAGRAPQPPVLAARRPSACTSSTTRSPVRCSPGRTSGRSSARRSRPGSASRWSTTRPAAASASSARAARRRVGARTAAPPPRSTTSTATAAARSDRCPRTARARRIS